ncbi:hypothetical protein ACFOEW_00510 [Alteromonas oceani]|uniref:Uncharacterized protein n=1 Tax=Alteromonas oceani TaxID=2071609 RepID=A0ABV7JT40_9ALTE|nr:hypothetical protein [Alteromonas oceani]
MGLLSRLLFGHSSDSSDLAGDDNLVNDSSTVVGINEATGLPLVSSGVTNCPGVIDVEGNPRGVDLSDGHTAQGCFLDAQEVISGSDCAADNTSGEISSSLDDGDMSSFYSSDCFGFDNDW